MPIKLDVKIEEMLAAARNIQPPNGDGDIVYGWDDASSVAVIGAHCGYDTEYDPNTGRRIKHRHKILVMSWQDQSIVSFDHAMTVPLSSRARVITPDGTGRLYAINDDSITVCLDTGTHVKYFNPDHVQLFNWDRINVTKTSND